MAKDILGREMAPGTPAAAYRGMAEGAGITQLARERLANPAKTLGQDARVGVNAAGRAAQTVGRAVNQAPKLIGKPAAGVANAVAKGVADFQTGFTGENYKPQAFEALSLGQMWDRTMKPGVAPAAAAPVAAPAVTQPAAPAATPAATPAAPALPSLSVSQSSSRRWVEDTSDSPIAQFYRAQQGQNAPAAPQPTGINVRRQANGVLEFSGSGGGNGTGAVTYNGLPNWKSAQGGAGQGSADFGGEAFKPAQAALAQGPGNPLLDRYQQLTEQVASGGGGIVGALQARSALRALAPILERQMANENSLTTTRMGNENARGIAEMETETRRRGQDLGLDSEMARVNASIYGTDVGARTAAADRAVEQDKIRATLLSAQAKAAAGKPLSQIEQLGLQIFEGKQFKTPAAQKKAMQEWILMFKGGNPFEQVMADTIATMQEGQ